MAQDQNKAAAPPKFLGAEDGETVQTGSHPAYPPALPTTDQAPATQEIASAQDFILAATSGALPPSLPIFSIGAQPSGQGYNKVPPPIPGVGGPLEDARPRTPPASDVATDETGAPARRAARRRPAGPARARIAANDDAPSIGGLIYALDQKPSTQPFRYAGIATGVWSLICIVFAWLIIKADLDNGASLGAILEKPTTFLTIAAIVAPIAIVWFLALLAWRSDELKLRSSTMTEVAIRLAEPDRMAEQSVASLGQAVRRQVSFMNDAISRALGRAGELEALVHNEVSALERSYEENERKIRGLISELSGERTALLDTSERVTETLRTLGTDIPGLIEKLSSQQLKLAHIIQGAGDNLAALETAVGQNVHKLESALDQSTGKLEHALGTRTEQLQGMLESYTAGLSFALGSRTDQLQDAIAGYVQTLDNSLSLRTENLKAVFEQYNSALDTSLTNRAEMLDSKLVERTRALDEAFGERLKVFDESIMRSTLAIDMAVTEKARALTSALDQHAKNFSETITRQTSDLDESLMQGISSVRRTSENITRQSLKAIEGLATQSDMLRNVSENLLAQINTATNRFENQGKQIISAASALEIANSRIDTTLQGRHAELSGTLERLSGKADEFGRFIEGYTTSLEGSLTDAERRARATAEQLRLGAEATRRSALEDLERLRSETGNESDRALDDLRRRFASISTVVNEQLSTLSSRLDQTSEDVRQRAGRVAEEIAAEQQRLREQMEGLPRAMRENAEAMRHALQDQLRAIEQLSALTNRTTHNRDVVPPLPQPTGPSAPQSLTQVYATEANRGLSSLSIPASELGARIGGNSLAPAPRGPLPPQQSPLARPGTDSREGWSLGDLLARASQDEEAQLKKRPSAPAVPLHNQIEVIARALDPSATAALWARINAGQRGVMVRSIYSPEGRAAFDDLTARYRLDPELQRTIDHYLSDFENLRRQAEQRDPSGRAVNAHLMSDMGRVYLFLAHATGRIT